MTGGRDIVVVGAGGHAKVIIECLRFAGWSVVGCTDADGSERTVAGVPVLGTDERLPALRSGGVGSAFCALGDNRLRERIGGKLLDLCFDLPSFQGPGALVSPSVRIGIGAAIMPGAVINAESRIGDFAIINTNANIDHDGVIGRAAHVGPGTAIAGEVTIGERSFIATGSAVIPQRRIGADTIVGAGSTVVRDLPDRVIAFGNPARVHRSI